jgi:hypothetical protein
MAASVDTNSTLDRIEFSDYGAYIIALFRQLETAVFVNLYALRTHVGRLLSAFMLIYFLSCTADRNTNYSEEDHQYESKKFS